MLQTIEAVIDEKGVLRFLQPVKLPKRRRVIITILDEEPTEDAVNLALLSEAALGKDWLRPEEDEAWSHLAQLQSVK
jgi:predicted DNA-binding antitoxin AbrB/MazE fold protein